MHKNLNSSAKIESKSKKLIKFAIVILLALASGLAIGMFYVNNFLGGVNYGSYSELGLRDDEDAIMKSEGTKPVNTLTGINAFIIAEQRLKEIKSITLNANGFINAMGVKQNIYTNRYKNESEYFVENISKGQIILGVDTNIAERDYYDELTDKVKVYKGNNIQETSATFKEMKEELSLLEWKKRNGTTPINFQPYIVSTKTIQSSTKPSPCTLDNGNAGYVVNMSLKPVGAYLYVNQIKNLSGLTDLPDFVFINLEVYFNQDGTFNKIVAEEEYKVKKMGMKVSTSSKMTYNFKYESTPIPTI